MLIIGYPVYWLELYVINKGDGNTSLLAASLFFLLVLVFKVKQRADIVQSCTGIIQSFGSESIFSRLLISAGSLLCLLILGISLYASLLPPHLGQEFDVINYHITIPRQHLLHGTFAHLQWSVADLYYLPVDFALAPYWLATELPNKFPQFLFFIGLICVCISLTKRFNNTFIGSVVILFAIFGSHNVGIQLGTAMLDITLCYLLLASLDSFLKGRIAIGAVELAFYVWSKSFIPIQSIILVFGLFLLIFILKRFGINNVQWSLHRKFNEGMLNRQKLKKSVWLFLIFSMFIGGPFAAKSIYYAGTPAFPFVPGIIQSKKIDRNSAAWQSLIEKAEQVRSVRDDYGSGRSPADFIRHLWLVAVPEKGVNNRYDYPVGLMYLLFIGPFIYLTVKSIRNGMIPLLPLFIILYWGLWWMGSQQSRFLFIPLTLMLIVVASEPKFHSKTLLCAMVLSVGLVCLSVVRAHKGDFGKWGYEALREKDKELIRASKAVDRGKPVVWNDFDVAYADFPVVVEDVESVFVLHY